MKWVSTPLWVIFQSCVSPCLMISVGRIDVAEGIVVWVWKLRERQLRCPAWRSSGRSPG